MIEERIYCIYMHTSPAEKSYIGLTKNYEKRCYNHRSSKSGCVAFKAAIEYYDWDNFMHLILEENLTLEEANIREIYWIEFYNTIAPNGYNLTTGGNNYKCSDETLEKMHISRSGSGCYWYGKTFSDEHREKISKSNIGKVHTEETKEILSISKSGKNNPMFGKTGELSPNFGLKRSDETKQKMKDNHWDCSGENSSMFGKFGKDNPCSKFYIITFPDEHEECILSLAEFCRIYNIGASTMTKVAKGKRRSHKGFKCRYATEQEIIDNTTIE